MGMLVGGLVTTARAQPAPGATAPEPAAPEPAQPATTPEPAQPAQPATVPAHDADRPPQPSAQPSRPVAAASTSRAEVATSPPPQTSSSAKRPVSVVLHVGYEVGGDDLLTVTSTGGDRSTITAGNGALIEGGLLISPPAHIAIELLLGVKTDSGSSENGHMSFSRGELSSIVSYANRGHRIGAGVTMHFSPSVNCSACGGASGLDNGYGLLLQWAYTYKHFDVGLRATLISYADQGSATGKPISGSSVGAFLGVRL